ncbi:MAG: tetratricopeptide repeat protein [Deltaproteobacteria bacterium]|nr:tetratricopeptide repeat protein [Deltaproteobacteria bacterium]
MFIRSLFAVAMTALIMIGSMSAAAGREHPRTLLHQGERFLAMGKYQAAIARYSKVIDCCEGTIEAAEAHNDLGVIHARQGNMDLAIQEYEAALQRTPYPLAHFNLGKALADRFSATGGEEVRKRALFHLETFQTYLVQARDLPPIVTWQQVEIEIFLKSAIENLSGSE